MDDDDDFSDILLVAVAATTAMVDSLAVPLLMIVHAGVAASKGCL